MSTSQAEEKSYSGSFIARTLGTIILLVLVILAGRSCNGAETPEATAEAAHMTTDTAMLDKDPAVRELLKVKLPNGVELDAYKGGIEDKLVSFLNNPASVAGKDQWFDFDNLNFKLGSAELTEESMKQVLNIDAILKAYPKLKIKIGGYTDKTGDSLSNIKLSGSRAEAVVTALKTNGASTTQLLGGEGYGSSFARVPATASDEERKMDRRISVGVRSL
jgi:outer membrane protein OmpA-like peptidoglycan-associated protein